MNYIENTKAAIAFMEALPDESVDLSDYRQTPWVDASRPCGSVACLGGWVAVMPHFQKLGVHPSRTGMPQMKNAHGEVLGALSVSIRLFDNAWLFSARSPAGEWYGGASDREVAIHRLKEHLKDLEKNE